MSAVNTDPTMTEWKTRLLEHDPQNKKTTTFEYGYAV